MLAGKKKIGLNVYPISTGSTGLTGLTGKPNKETLK
jgi:hypothetical protein